MKCTNCGNNIRPDDEFCEKCGMRVEPDIVYEERDVREDPDEDIAGDTISMEETGEKPPKKLSKWTTAGIVAAVGITGAFVTAIVANNIGNIFGSPDESIVAQEETTTTKETTTAAPATEAADDKPESAVYSEPGSRTDTGNDDHGYERPSRDSNSSYDDSDSSDSDSYGSNRSDRDTYSYDDRSNSNDEFYNKGWSSDNSDSDTDYTPSESEATESPYYYSYGDDNSGSSGSSDSDNESSEVYDSGSEQWSYGDPSNGDYNYGDEIRRYLEGAGDQIIEYGQQIDSGLNDTVNGYRDRINDLRSQVGW